MKVTKKDKGVVVNHNNEEYNQACLNLKKEKSRCVHWEREDDGKRVYIAFIDKGDGGEGVCPCRNIMCIR